MLVWWRSRLASIHALLLSRLRSLKNRKVSRVKTGVGFGMWVSIPLFFFEGGNGDSQPTPFRSGVNSCASRLALAGTHLQQLVFAHEQLYSNRKNQGPPQTGSRKLRPRIDLSHP